MKRRPLYILFLLAVSALFWQACSNDDNPSVPFTTSGFFTARTNANGHIIRLTDDMGKVYNVREDSKLLTPDTTIRVVASIQAQGADTVIYSKTFPISETPVRDQLIPNGKKVQDPVILKSIYVGGGHLNIHLGIKVKNETTNHDILYSRISDTKKLRLQLYHDAHNDDPIYTQNLYLSIPLSSYHLHKNDTVYFSYKSFEGDCVRKIVYK